MAIWLVLLFTGMLGMVPVTYYLDKRPDEFRWIANVAGSVVLGLFLAGFGFIAWYGIRQQRKGPRCPHCSKPLLLLNAKIAIATGNCAECGEKVFTA